MGLLHRPLQPITYVHNTCCLSANGHCTIHSLLLLRVVKPPWEFTRGDDRSVMRASLHGGIFVFPLPVGHCCPLQSPGRRSCAPSCCSRQLRIVSCAAHCRLLLTCRQLCSTKAFTDSLNSRRRHWVQQRVQMMRHMLQEAIAQTR